MAISSSRDSSFLDGISFFPSGGKGCSCVYTSCSSEPEVLPHEDEEEDDGSELSDSLASEEPDEDVSSSS